MFPVKPEEAGHSFLAGVQDQPTQPRHPAELIPVREFLVNKINYTLTRAIGSLKYCIL